MNLQKLQGDTEEIETFKLEDPITSDTDNLKSQKSKKSEEEVEVKQPDENKIDFDEEHRFIYYDDKSSEEIVHHKWSKKDKSYLENSPVSKKSKYTNNSHSGRDNNMSSNKKSSEMTIEKEFKQKMRNDYDDVEP